MTIDIERLRKLCEEATPGPWTNTYRGTAMKQVSRIPHGDDGRRQRIASTCGYGNKYEEDAAFIAESRTALPALISELTRYKRAVERLAEQDVDLCHACPIGEWTCKEANEYPTRDECRAKIIAWSLKPEEVRPDAEADS